MLIIIKNYSRYKTNTREFIMQISIVLPIYKVEKYLEECLNSIKNQNFQDFEAIMVDDGSPDNSAQICQKFSAEDSRFKYVHQENQGVSVARNTGLKYAQGKYIYFMDPDDTFSPDFLQAMYDEAEKNGVDMVVNPVVYTNLADKTLLPLSKTTPGIYEASLQNYFPEGYLWFKLYRKELLDKADVSFLKGCHLREDELFGMMLYPYCRSYAIIRQGWYHYRQHGESALARAERNKKLYAESIVVSLPVIFEFFYKRQLFDYFPLALNLLPYPHGWYSVLDYWRLIQEISRKYKLTEWKNYLHPYLQAAVKPQSFPLFLFRMMKLYGKGRLKQIRKQMISVKMRKNYKLVRILGITLLEKGDREYKNKKIA